MCGGARNKSLVGNGRCTNNALPNFVSMNIEIDDWVREVAPEESSAAAMTLRMFGLD